jgi:hypothetical protein
MIFALLLVVVSVIGGGAVYNNFRIMDLERSYDALVKAPPTFTDQITSNSIWMTSSPQGGACRFSASGFHVTATVKNKSPNCLKAGGAVTSGNNFLYSVHLSVMTGDGGGLIFGHTPNLGYYYVYIHVDGTYSIGVARGPLLKAGKSPWIFPGLTRINLLALMVLQDQIHLFINDHYVDTVVAINTLATTTDIGITAISSQPNGDVVFSEARVWASYNPSSGIAAPSQITSASIQKS